MDNKKPLKVVFAPGCFDSFEGSQEELDELVKLIEDGLTDGSLLENAVPLSEFDEDEFEELFEDNAPRTIN